MIMTMKNREQYAVADIGSNTVVLIVYEIENGMPIVCRYESDAAHLIDDVKDGIMTREGIAKAQTILAGYAGILDEMQVSRRYADITEPGRIANRDELVRALEATGFITVPLSGEMEAVLDYRGAVLSWPDIHTGAAFDVGGGSTELIAFENDRVTAAVSLPLGCVRLSHLPIDTEVCAQALRSIQEQEPSLAREYRRLIGIGGTMRAAGLLADDLYRCGKVLPVKQLRELFARLLAQEPEAVEAMHRTVHESRIPVLLPGIHMILAIADALQAEEICVSDTGIREGFLLEMAKEEN